MNPLPPRTRGQDALGPQYWRSLDELSDTPAFRAWVEREFPQGASEWHDPVSRRHFVKIMSASFMLAGLGLSGCRRPEETIHPFSKMPENYTHGVPQFYATVMPDRNGAQALLVKSLDGRPIKVEGNPRHPTGLTGTDRFAQASILDLYDVDRAARFLKNGTPVTREAAFDGLSAVAKQIAADAGDGVCFLLGHSSSPSRERLQTALQKKYPRAGFFSYEAIDYQAHREAATLAHQVAPATDPLLASGLKPYYRLDKAKVIVSLDCDFIGGEEDSSRLIRDFSRGRKIEKPEEEPTRVYVAEGLMTLTGANADHRLRLPAGQVGAVAAHLAMAVLKAGGNTAGAELLAKLPGVALPAAVKPEWIAQCAADLTAHRGTSVVMAGCRQPLAVHLLANALNGALGNDGATVELHAFAGPKSGTIEELAARLGAGQVKTLVICGGNPGYSAPVDLDWAAAQRKAKTVIRLGYHEDETAQACDWLIPAAHYLESWGDARTSDGTLVAVQPLIAPLFDGLTELELLARLGGMDVVTPHQIARDTFKTLVSGGDFELEWNKFLREGFQPNTANRHTEAPLDWTRIAAGATGFTASAPAKDNLEVIFHRDYRVDDGRFNNNGWLQELPDPVTKITWENVLTMSIKTAREHGVYFENKEVGKLRVPIAKVEYNGRVIEGPVWLQPGQADYTIGLALGYGRTNTGRVGEKSGYNAYRLRASANRQFGTGARLSAQGDTHPIATTQAHWLMEGRPIIREANLEQFRQHPDFVKNMDLDAHEPKDAALYKHPHAKDPTMKGIHQWGMAVDLQRCVGCSACMMACQSENNIPIVGKGQVARGREMHWIRLDRYYSVAPEDKELSNPQVMNQPMLCQHCENAPCESVCPVNATVHDDEGLNVMVYNRCVGTRYCSNNCPYKVRRFNFFDYNQRPIDRLYQGPLAPKGMPDLVQMVKNPEVTVRMRGVMEKCTFCIQRIEQAKIAQKVKAGPSDDVRVRDGTITPACAQACPAEAIVFGDVADPESRVSRIKQQPRDYSVLGFLYTKPRTTYQARIRNPNPKMPDYQTQPLSLAEYSRLSGDPMAAPHHEEGEKTGASEKGGH